MPKTSFIFAFTDPDRWSTPISVVNEFKARGWDTHLVSLYNDKAQYTDDNLINFINSPDSSESDIIMFFDYGMYDSDWLNKKHFPNSFFVGEMGDELQNFHKNFPKSHKFDLIHTPDHSCYLKYKEAGRNCLWLTHFADTRIHYPLTDQLPWKMNTAPVRSTRGYGGSPLLDALSSIMGPDKFVNRNNMFGEEYGLFLAEAKIVVQQSRHKEITRRMFEAAACGAMVLTDRLPEKTNIDSIFTEGDDIVYYDSLPHCISLINYYLSPEGSADRIRIAGNGRGVIINGHTQSHRVDAILNEYYEYKRNEHTN